jgi:preprotein translocase subunit SecG
MSILIVVIHLIACLALIAIVLLQTGKGAEMGAAFGGASQTLFGGSGGSSFMSKLTTGAAIVFMITCLLLSFMHRTGFQGGRSVMTEVPPVEQPQAPPLTEPQQQAAPEALPVQPPPPEARPLQPEATPKAVEAPAQAPEAAKKPAAAQQQSQQGQKKAPAKKQ